MNAEELIRLQELIKAHKRRLHALQVRAAKYGINCPTEVVLEIEDIDETLSDLEKQARQDNLLSFLESRESLKSIDYQLQGIDHKISNISTTEKRVYRFLGIPIFSVSIIVSQTIQVIGIIASAAIIISLLGFVITTASKKLDNPESMVSHRTPSPKFPAIDSPTELARNTSEALESTPSPTDLPSSTSEIVEATSLPPETQNGVDFVFLLDQSASMSKGSRIDVSLPSCTPVVTEKCPRNPPNDPNGEALNSIRVGLQTVAETLVARTQQNGGVVADTYRASLIVFGGDANAGRNNTKTIFPLSTIRTETDPQGSISSNLSDEVPTIQEDLSNTTFSFGFDEVCKVLECDSAQPTTRRRIIILLTDGEPARDRFSYSASNPKIYFDALRQRHENLFSVAKLRVIALEKSNSYWSQAGPYWSDIAEGQAFVITNPQLFSENMRRIIEKELKQ